LAGVLAAAPYVNVQGMLTYDGSVRGALIRGILPEREERVAEFGNHIKSGTLEALKPGDFGIVLGAELARALAVMVGDKLTLIAPQGQVTPAGIMPRLKQFRVVGIFDVGMFEYDSGLALIHLEDAQKLYRMQDKVSGVRLKLRDLFQSREVALGLLSKLGGDAYVTDWTRSHANFFRAVQMEKNVMFIILLLIVAVAAFNIVSTLVMAVTDKQPDIAILRTLGAAPPGIMVVFMVQGALIGVIGTLIGVGAGVLLALNIDVVVPFIESLFNVHFLAKDVYYINELPSDLQGKDVATIALVSFVLSLLATLYPSWRASQVNPAEALRYE
jgi:lipoprotein-releasing system permease protein